VVFPWGEYFPDRLINLGSNRYVIRPSLGLLHRRGPWEFEVTTSLSFYQDNDAYYPGASVLERDPLWFLQVHVTRELPRGQWLTLSGGYSYDGELFLNGQSLDYTERTSFLSLGWGMALTRQQSIRVACVRADTQVALPAARPTRSAAEMERSAPIAARALRETRDRPGGRPTRPCAGHRSWDKTHVACS